MSADGYSSETEILIRTPQRYRHWVSPRVLGSDVGPIQPLLSARPPFPIKVSAQFSLALDLLSGHVDSACGGSADTFGYAFRKIGQSAIRPVCDCFGRQSLRWSCRKLARGTAAVQVFLLTCCLGSRSLPEWEVC